MLRSVAVIAWAIGLSSPSMPASQRMAYAKVLRETARKHRFDPFTAIAIIEHESHWHAGAVSPDGEDFGLGQVRARYLRGCAPTIPAAQDKSSSCQAVKARLLNGSYAIRRIGMAITSWRKTCRRLTGNPVWLYRMLHGYGGMGNLKKRPRLICGQKQGVDGRWRDVKVRKPIRDIMAIRKRLIRKLSRRRSR